MKIVLFGGGSHRYLGVMRSVMAAPGLMEQGEINLYDLAVERAEAVGRLAMKSPEYATANCSVTWGTTLDEALDGADVVFVVLMGGTRRNFDLLCSACSGHGFMASDQLSPSGAMLALKAGPILMDLAGRMERRCPDALLADYANPVAVLSAAVNNHTRISCLGVCGGYTNHQWDLPRALFGRDEQWPDFDIRCAGVNHMSFIQPGSTWRDQDVYALARERFTTDWRAPVLSDRWTERQKANITQGLISLVAFYHKYGALVFSTEGDGLAHLDMAGRYAADVGNDRKRSAAALRRSDREREALGAEGDRAFRAWLDVDLEQADWDVERPGARYLLRVDEDIMVRIVRAWGGMGELQIATSRPQHGAVRGFKDRTVLEYSQVLGRNAIRSAGTFEVPDVLHGLVTALATHQTLLADAIATRDPRILFEALYSYPVQQDTAESKAMWRDLIAIAGEEIPAEFQGARELFTI